MLAPTDAALGQAVVTEPRVPQRIRQGLNAQLPHEHLLVLAIYLTVGLSVLAHGLTAAPLAGRYARWYERHPREKAPPMESAPAEVTRPRGPAGRLTSVTGDRDRTPASPRRQ